MGNTFLEREARRVNISNSHKHSKKQEKKLAIRVGGKLTPASGARDVKGDVKLHRVMRIEAKTTKNKSFSVTLDMIEKIELAALTGTELPMIVIQFTDGFNRILKEVAVCPTYVIDTIAENSK